MGLRGPAPTPTALKIISGNPGHRPLNAHEPKPRDCAPACPAHVRSDDAAYREWRRLVPILKRMRVLTEADGQILANLCIVHSHLLANLAKVRELNQNGTSGIAGIVIATKSGYLAPNQLYINVQTHIEQELKLCRELGLTPAARSRIQVAAEKQSDPDDLLNGNWKA